MDRLPASPLIQRAIAIAETKIGLIELADRLRAAPETVQAWRAGLSSMPQTKFLLLVDVLTALEPAWEDWDNKE